MNGNLVITIGRQCGSKGMLVGQKLAEAMGVKSVMAAYTCNASIKELQQEGQQCVSGTIIA